MTTRIEYGRYRLTWVNGKPCAAWSFKDEATGEYKRPRHALDVKSDASPAELRAALIAFAAKQEREELRANSSTVAAILDAYAAHRERDGKVMRPIISNIRQLKPFFGQMAPGVITDETCRAYTAERAKAGCSGSTIVTELGRLSTALQWAVKQKIISRDELPVMWYPHRSEPKDRVLSEDEFARLHDQCRGHVKLFVLLCLLTGGRTSAILELTWDRVSFDNRIIDLRAPKTVNILQKVVRKGRAVVHMDDTLLGALSAAKAVAETGHVIEYMGRPLKEIGAAFKKAVRRAGLGNDVSPHTLRHTAATWAELGKVPHEQIARLLGHSKPQVTQGNYLHRQAEMTKGAVEAVAARLPKLKAVK